MKPAPTYCERLSARISEIDRAVRNAESALSSGGGHAAGLIQARLLDIRAVAAALRAEVATLHAASLAVPLVAVGQGRDGSELSSALVGAGADRG